MKFYINNLSLEFENDYTNLELVSNAIQNHLTKEQLYINHYIVDGIIIYNDFNHYLSDHIEEIQKNEVITQTLNQLIVEILQSTDDYIAKAIPFIHEYTRDFHQESSETKLMELMEALDWIFQTFMKMNSRLTKADTLTRYGAWKKYWKVVSRLEEVIIKLGESILSKDNTATIEVLESEVIPLFINMKEQIRYLRNYMMICI